MAELKKIVSHMDESFSIKNEPNHNELTMYVIINNKTLN